MKRKTKNYQVEDNFRFNKGFIRKNSITPKDIRACAAKKRYPTQQEAKRICRYMKTKFPEKNYRYYACTICMNFHITSQEKASNSKK